jgi:hypothetical protein
VKERHRYRLHVEELEQRAVPAALTPGLTGRHALHATISGLYFPYGTTLFRVAGGLLKGNALFMSGIITEMTTPTQSYPGYTDAVIRITTPRGNAVTVNTGFADTVAGTFVNSGKIVGGTGMFKGATGRFFISSSFTAPSTITGSLIGFIAGPGTHIGQAHRR